MGMLVEMGRRVNEEFGHSQAERDQVVYIPG